MENINLNTEHGFQQLKPAEGFVITSYTEGKDDIKDYYSTTEVDAPMDADLSEYRAVTLEQDAIYESQKEEAMKKFREEEEANRAKEMEARRMNFEKDMAE